MITVEQVLKIHHKAIEKFGGAKGVRDIDLLQSAITRPYATFDGIELYNSPSKKASAIVESIVKNHPFTDGNKRTGYILMRFFFTEIRKRH